MLLSTICPGGGVLDLGFDRLETHSIECQKAPPLSQYGIRDSLGFVRSGKRGQKEEIKPPPCWDVGVGKA